MTRVLRTFLCRLLIVLTAWTPFQMASASMIGTEQTAAPAAQAERARVLGVLERADVAGQLAGFGIDAAQAKDRVQAMNDDEVRALSQQIDSLPAGGIHGAAAWIVVLVIVGGIAWWFMQRR